MCVKKMDDARGYVRDVEYNRKKPNGVKLCGEMSENGGRMALTTENNDIKINVNYFQFKRKRGCSHERRKKGNNI